MPSAENANRYISSTRPSALNAEPAWKNANSMQSLSIRRKERYENDKTDH
jgi:hypothetical protein